MRYQCRQSQPFGALFLLSWLYNVIEASSILFTGATIITFDVDSSRTDTIFDSSLLVENDRVSRIYVGSTPASYPNSTQVIDATGKIISPGFIDTHHHLWQTAFKTIASNVTLSEYSQKYGASGPSIQSFTPEDKYLSQLMGCFELLNSGTTTVLDHAHGITSNETADMLLDAMLDSKIRGFYAVGIQDLQLDNFTVQDQLNKLISQSQDPRLENSATSLGLSYDTFEATPSETLQYLWQLVQAQNLSVVTTHYLSGPWVSSNSPTLLDQHGWLNSSVPVVFSHASYLTSEDMTTLRSTNQYISTTPESEMHYGHGHPHVDLIQDQASLGIDTHFTYSADMVAQARLWLQTLRLRRFMPVLEDSKIPIHSPMSVEQAFYLITRAGGLALRREDLGVIKEGAKADLVVFDGESPGMLGWSDAVAAIILHSNVGDVEHVLVDGVFVKKDRKIVVEEYAGTKQRFLESKNRIQKIWRERDWGSWSEGKWSGVTEFGEVEMIDTLRGDGTGY